MSCKLKARLASLNNFTRLRGEAGGDYCSRSVRIFKLQQNRIARIKEWRIKWEVCELIRNVNISDDKRTGGHVLWSNPQPAVISLSAQKEPVLFSWFIRCSPLWGNRIVIHSYISYMGLALQKTFHSINYSLALCFPCYEYFKAMPCWWCEAGRCQRAGAENLFLAEIFKNLHFYLLMSSVHNNLVPSKITIHSALLQHLLSMCHSSSTWKIKAVLRMGK